MLKEFLLKKMIKSKMPGVTDDQINQVVPLVQKNPALFKKIGDEAQAKIKLGMAQDKAMMAVMQAHASELKGLMG